MKSKKKRNSRSNVNLDSGLEISPDVSENSIASNSQNRQSRSAKKNKS